jgi:hypothetical protein
MILTGSVLNCAAEGVPFQPLRSLWLKGWHPQPIRD